MRRWPNRDAQSLRRSFGRCPSRAGSTSSVGSTSAWVVIQIITYCMTKEVSMTTLLKSRAKAGRKRRSAKAAVCPNALTAAKTRFVLEVARASGLGGGEKTYLLKRPAERGSCCGCEEKDGYHLRHPARGSCVGVSRHRRRFRRMARDPRWPTTGGL